MQEALAKYVRYTGTGQCFYKILYMLVVRAWAWGPQKVLVLTVAALSFSFRQLQLSLFLFF